MPTKVHIQNEPRYELIGEPGPFVMYEVDEDGSVTSTAYYASFDEAKQAALTAAEEGEIEVAEDVDTSSPEVEVDEPTPTVESEE